MQELIARLAAAKKDMPGALLPLLHDIQDALGYIPPDAIATVAQALNRSRAEVHGVVTFYHYFRTSPPGRQIVQVCRAEACRSMGSDALWAHACKQIQVNPQEAAHGATSADGATTLQPVYCLGLCSTAPAITVDDQVHARVSVDHFDRLVAGTGSKA